MKISTTKILVTALIGLAVVILGFTLLLRQAEPIKSFDCLSFLTSLAAFLYAIYQVVQESAAKETQRKILSSILDSVNASIARMHQFSLHQDPSANLSELLIGILEQEQVHIAGILRSHHTISTQLLESPAAISSKMETELIDGQDKVRTTLKSITNEARDFIFIVGGRSRDRDYLECLLARLRRGDLEHFRLVTGDHIRKPLFDHLRALEEIRKADENFRCTIGYLKEDKYGSFTVTRDCVFLALPSSTETQLTTGVLIRNPKVASDLRAHVVALASGQHEEKNLAFFQSICKDYSPNGTRPS